MATVAAPSPIASQDRNASCGDPAASALAVTPRTIARNPPVTARWTQVSSRTLLSPSQNSSSARPAGSAAAVAILALSWRGADTRYGGRTAS